MKKNIMDQLIDSEIQDIPDIPEELLLELAIPARCLNCNTTPVCSIYPSFIKLSEIGIIISIEKCPFSVPTKSDKKD